MTSKDFRFDFDSFRIGTAEYTDAPTGCTVFHFPRGALAAVDVRGGAAALRESTLLDPISESSRIDALVLAGGSTYGLDAAAGVMKRLLEDRGGKVAFQDIPSVPAAVVYDFTGRNSAAETRYPDAALGLQALESARSGSVRVGRAGAGANVSVGKYFGRDLAERSGQGAAFLHSSHLKIFVLTVLNAVGNVLDLEGRVVAGTRDPKTGLRAPIARVIQDRLESGAQESGVSPDSARGNTTLSVVITNARLDRLELSRIAMMAHSAMARVIEPFHTPWDGDALFALSTEEFDRPPTLTPNDLGTLAGSLLQKAVLQAVESPQ